MVNEASALSQSNTSGRGIAADVSGYECALTRGAKERYTTADGKTWLIDSAVLEEIDNDLQEIVNCTKKGDVLSFSATDVVRPSSRITIPWQLTLMTQAKNADSNDGVSPNQRTKSKTTFTCPHKNSGLFLVQSMNITFVDLVVEKCTFDGTDGTRAIIEVATCHSQETHGLVALHRVVFRKNDLIAASGLRMPPPSCSELEMVEVSISENVCSGEACGVHLAEKNRLENCVAFGNRIAETSEQQSSLVYGAELSNTTIQGFTVRENKLSGVTIQNGTLTVSKASFERNFLDTRTSKKIKKHCLHLVKTSAHIEQCVFIANEGNRGFGILARESKLSVFSSVFISNVGFENGGCVYVKDTKAKFVYINAIANSAQDYGGFMLASSSTVKLEKTNAVSNRAKQGGFMNVQENSNVTLERTNATANIAEEYGGFMYALSSTVTLERTNATENSAQDYGGFMLASSSTVKLDKTNAVNNRAKQGGFMNVQMNSNVTLEGTNATANSAQDGGFMLALNSTVKLDKTNATANSAEENGGFMYAWISTVKLEETTAVSNRARHGGFMNVQQNLNVTLERTNATTNSAEENGGFMYAWISTVKLEETNAVSNRARHGGFMNVHQNSNVTLERTNSTTNSAEEYGGFMLASISTVKLDETNAVSNRAKQGGFMNVQANSNVTLERTNATANSAEENGGFMLALNSTVKLDKTNATANNAEEYGGFVSASTSTVKLDETNAVSNRARQGGFMNVQDNSNVTLERTNATENSAEEYGGFMYASISTVKLDETNAVSNRAKQGGFMNVQMNSTVTLERTNATTNSAQDGGFMVALNSIVKLDKTNATANRAQEYGGFMYAWISTVKLDETTAVSNRAKQGGFMNVQTNSNVTLERTNATTNSAQEYGGFMLASSTTVKLDETNAVNNRARQGGFINVQTNSNVTLERTNATANSAEEYGGFMYASISTVKLDETNAVSNRARQGGFMNVQANSKVKLDKTKATANIAEEYGGFMLASSTTVKLDETKAVNNRARQGGFMNVQANSNVTLERTNATANSAEENGGFMLALNSTVKLDKTNATANSAEEYGGFMYASTSTVKLDETNAVSNRAKQGGFMNVEVNSNVTLERTNATANSAQANGGFMVALSLTVKLVKTNATANSAAENGGFMLAWNSTVKLDETNAIANSAEGYGGFMLALSSIVKLDETNAVRNRAKQGGFMNVQMNSNVTIERTNATSNSAEENGGFMLASSTTVKLDETKAVSNKAEQGGFMQIEKSNVTLECTHAALNCAVMGGFVRLVESNVTMEQTSATDHNAREGGGFMSALNSTVKMDGTNAMNNSAIERGGFMHTANSTVTMECTTAVDSMSKRGSFFWASNSSLGISQSHFLLGSAKIYGGFAAVIKNSSVLIINSTVEEAISKSGGAIRLKKSHLVARNLSILHCEADESGGGVYGFASSTLLCSDCKLYNNSAKGGKGGAIFFDVDPEQNLALQLVQSRIENNVANMGGGLFFVCGKRIEECLANSTDCPFAVFVETQFSGNEASVGGGAVFTGHSEAIRFRCTNGSSNANLQFYQEKEWKILRQAQSDKDICSSWRGNRAGVYGQVIATYAATAEMTLEDTNKFVCLSGKENCAIDGYRTGTDLPTATVVLLDGLRQSPARNYRLVYANMSSPSSEFLFWPISLPMENGSCTFRAVKGFVAPGEYNLTVEFGEKAIRNIGITVRVDNCSVGEMVSDAEFCVNCSSTTYNFQLSAKVCKPCPENGNCETHVITPEDGYWQQMPCSDHLHRCLPTSACEYEDRSVDLKDIVRDVSSCDFEEEWIEDYTRAQCAEGYMGPLCGSCEENFGSGLSSECGRCLKGFFNVGYVLTSAIFLLAMTGITIHGTISAPHGNTSQTQDQSTPSSSAEVIESPLLGEEVQAVGVPASEKTLAKWKAVEMFKITLGYIQTTVLLASLDVGWAIPVIIMAAVAELLGGLASDGIRRSVVCLSSKHMSFRPTAMALVVSVCVVPCAVLLFWIVFWAAKSARSGNDRLPRYLSKRCLLSATVTWYVTLVPVLKTTLSVFLCVDVYDSADFAEVNTTHVYWAVDTSMKCYEGDHVKLLYGVVVAFVCPVYGGLLALFVVYLKRPPQHLIHKRYWAYQTTGFLYRSYRMDRHRYWEVAIVLRKVAIAFLVFCAHLFDSGLPITGAAYVIMLAILVHILAMPYREDFKDLNRMELASLFVSLATTLAASMLKDESYPQNFTRELLTVACALLNVIAFFVFAFYILKFAAEFLRYKLMERGDHSASDAGMFRIMASWIVYEVKHLIGKMCKTSDDPEIAEQSADEA